ncbi:SDR family oxidoreductase [Alloalcanivorax marinus]|uniref:SDR family oxidoreductase n=1 Tax=Alloalcanivorax marinus TaxID=1177169 RepID=UPI00195C4C15|nr:SDR family oxidoreductase [Alloalcanivorax marinus]MBM7335466.1 SDR family oxidoreductase [Alloalcanivorax marinus]
MSGSPERCWLLLGASGGIGKEVLRGLLDRGDRVLVASRRGVSPIQHERAVPVRLDLSAPDLGARVVDLIAEQGLPDGLIHCAGINHFVAAEGNDDAGLAETLDVNLRSALVLTRELLPGLRRRDRGTLLFVGSTFGSIGYPGYTAYCASKFGLRGFTEALRRELADTPIRVRYVAPRATRTAMNGHRVEAMNRTLGNRMDAPEAVARRLLRALDGRPANTFLGWPEKLFVRLNALLPRLVDKALRKQLPVIQRFLKQGASS